MVVTGVAIALLAFRAAAGQPAVSRADVRPTAKASVLSASLRGEPEQMNSRRGAHTLLASRPRGVFGGARAGDMGLDAAGSRDRGPGTAAPMADTAAWPRAGMRSSDIVPQPARARAQWWAPLVSAALPGGGQALLEQDRALAYLAVEAYGWLRFASDVREARGQRDGYRKLAARVARANLSETRPVGDFEYYERMENFVESGVFDASAAEGVQPETDPESYNGFIWLRARTTFFEDPAAPPPVESDAYAAALDYYDGRAIKPEFRWSWRNAQLEQDVFRRTISRSNEAFRRSIQDLGVIIANHALSTVDAYISVRIRNLGRVSEGVGIEASLPWSPRLPGRR